MSPRYFAKAHENRWYKTAHYVETEEAKLEQKVESTVAYLWRMLWRKR
jgi:hypothetical protein